MVSEQVEVISKSWQEPDKAHRWVCDGSPEYSLEATERSERGTDIVLHISEENKEFLENERIKHILEKYGRFLPVPVFFEWHQQH
jgi:molecular chaperone HtpG